MFPLRLLLLLLLLLHTCLAAETCFFVSSKRCPNYCCRGDEAFSEYCCDDCSKSASQTCFTGNPGLVMGVVFGVVVLLGVIGGVIAVLCVLGCICSNLTGRPPFSQRGRVIRAPAQQTSYQPQAQPLVTAPYAAQPVATAPYAAQPASTAPYPSQPVATAPYAAQPVATAPYPAQPASTAPYPAQPGATAPYPAQPGATAPYPAQPGAYPPPTAPYNPGGFAPPAGYPVQNPGVQPDHMGKG